jgi:hypothetical protein
MFKDGPSNGANVGSEAADEADRTSRSVPNAHDDCDATTVEDDVSATSTTLSSKVKKRRTGRRPKLTPEALKNIRAGVVDGLPLEVAATRAGVSKSTFYAGLNDGELALDKQAKGQALSDRERRGLEVKNMLQDALAERLARLQEKRGAEATNHSKTTTKIVWKPLVYKGNVLRDEDGELVMVPTVSIATTEEPDIRLLETLYNQTHSLLAKLADTEPETKTADNKQDLTETVEQRLSRSIHVRLDQINEDRDEEVERLVSERLKAYGITAPKSAAAHAYVTDDNDDYYELSPWMSPYVPEFDSGNSGNSDVDRGM